MDSSFYRPPSARNCALWTERTPPEFRFHVKAYRVLTWHDRDNIPDATALGDLARQFTTAVEPMRAAGKLVALHFQFPAWFQARDAERDYLAELRQALPDHTLAVEFRHRSWFVGRDETEATLDLLRAHDFVHTVVDQPQIGSGSVPFVPVVTRRSLAILRLHGRNAQTWYKRTDTSGERFKYRYSVDELRSFVEPIRALAAEAADVHVLTNNNYQDSAVRNAAELAQLLALGYGDPGADAPATGA